MSQVNDEYIKKYVKASQVKVGDIVIIKGRPCKVISVSVSKTGKHGNSKTHFKFADFDDWFHSNSDIEVE